MVVLLLLGQYQFSRTCCAECVNHAFMLDKHAWAPVEQILAPDRRLKLAASGLVGMVATEWWRRSFIHETGNRMRLIRI